MQLCRPRPAPAGRRGIAMAAGLLASAVPGAGAATLRLVEAARFELPYPAFVEPVAVAAGPLGQVFVADRGRGTVFRLGADAHIDYEFESPPRQAGMQPLDVEVTGFQVYVLDAVSKALLRFSQQGGYLDVLQTFTSSNHGFPGAVSVDATGRVLVTDPSRHVVRIVDETQKIESVIGGFGARAGELSRPQGVAFTPQGSFFVVDTGNRRVQRFDEVGNYVGTLADSLREPRGIATGTAGVVFVADAVGAVHAFTTRSEDGGQHAVLELPGVQPLDVAAQGEELWVLSQEPHALLRVRVVWGD